jgi:thiol-disulfide isomerase/thioredoxin
MILFNRRKFLFFATMFLASFISTQPAFAEGGEDPMPGIDIIIEKDPSVEPITHFSLDNQQIKQFNQLKGVGRSKYLASVIVAHLAQVGVVKDKSKAATQITEQLGASWCGPCRMVRGQRGLSRKLHLKGPVFNLPISALITAASHKFGLTATPQKLGDMNDKGASEYFYKSRSEFN